MSNIGKTDVNKLKAIGLSDWLISRLNNLGDAGYDLPLVLGPDGIVTIAQADEDNDGYLSAADWAAFNGGSSWASSGNDIYNSNIGNVGIGGAPGGTHKFEVIGGAKFSSDIEVNSLKISRGTTNNAGSLSIGQNNFPVMGMSQTVAIGYDIFSAAGSIATVYGNTIIGHQAAKGVVNGSTFDNVVIGTFAMLGSTGGFNATVAIGKLALRYATGVGNVGIGRHVANGISTGNYNIAIGYMAEVPVGTADNQLSIGNWIYGKSGRISIGVSAPVDCAILDLTSTTGGLVLPRMTKVQRDAIASPVAGLAVYQTDNTPGLRVYNGTNWMRYTETAD